MDVKDLHRQGYSIRQIARITGHTRNTVKRKLSETFPEPFSAPARSSHLDPYKAYLEGRFRECGLSGVRLLDEIRPMGYTGSVDIVRRFINTLRPSQVAVQKATVRFETPPGQQGQADWAYCGRFPDRTGTMVPIYAFVFVLGFSRMLFIRFTTSMDVPALIDCHQRAFNYLGGWPREILYDNMKQVKLGPNEWNPLLLDFANHYGLTPKTHRIRRPRTKGKVERMVFYVKDNFLNGRSFANLDDLNAQGLHWLDSTANARVHATTQEKPADLLGQEGLTPVLSITPYKLYPTRLAKVSAESFVRIGGSRYSVPPSYVGQTVTVTLRERRIVIRSGNLIVFEHDKADQPGACVAAKEHLAELWKLSLASSEGPAPHWQMTFRQDVAATPLSQYEAAAGCFQPDYEAAVENCKAADQQEVAA
uniref:IstA transposase IS21 family protein n=1 Tax=uncultured bacterium RM44 TaxID=672208 RepID=D3W8M3_9BACT|nr:IstA transposase IS21 family protein [uncultured bacterium RM44]